MVSKASEVSVQAFSLVPTLPKQSQERVILHEVSPTLALFLQAVQPFLLAVLLSVLRPLF